MKKKTKLSLVDILNCLQQLNYSELPHSYYQNDKVWENICKTLKRKNNFKNRKAIHHFIQEHPEQLKTFASTTDLPGNDLKNEDCIKIQKINKEDFMSELGLKQKTTIKNEEIKNDHQFTCSLNQGKTIHKRTLKRPKRYNSNEFELSCQIKQKVKAENIYSESKSYLDNDKNSVIRDNFEENVSICDKDDEILQSEDENSSKNKEITKEEDNENFLFSDVPRFFNIRIPLSKWKNVKPAKKTKHKKWRRLQGDWTDVFQSAFSDIVPSCVLVFYYNRVKKKHSRKTLSPFFSGKARCKFPTCSIYKFTIQDDPGKNESEVIVEVERKGSVKHEKNKKMKRHLKGKRRQHYGKKVVKKGPGNVHYHKLAEMKEESVLMGNMTECVDEKTLYQVGYEKRKEEFLHNDYMVELLMVKDIAESMDDQSKKVHGYVHFISVMPFIMIMYTEEQFSLWKEEINRGNDVAYFDATGSIVQKLKGQEKDTYYYTMVMRNLTSKEPALPIAEMVSTDHTTPTISYFFMKIRWIYMMLHQKQPPLRRIEIDFSWPFINAILHVFNKQDIGTYLQKAWEILHGRLHIQFTIIHLCAWHMFRNFAKDVNKSVQENELKKFIKYCFALLQNSSNLKEASKLYSDIVCLLMSKSDTDKTKESFIYLRKCIKNMPEKLSVDESNVLLCDIPVTEDPHIEGKLVSIKDKSPFNSFFKTIRLNHEQVQQEDNNLAPSNDYYSPLGLKCIEKHLHLYPLWSGSLLGNLERHYQDNIDTDENAETRDTQCYVENFMGIVKNSILQKQRRLRPGMFAKRMLKNIRGRIRKYRITRPLVLSTKSKSPDKKKTISTELTEEKWKGKRKGRKSSYYMSPKKFPIPKTSEKESKQHQKKPTNIKCSIINNQNNCWLNATLQALKVTHQQFFKGKDITSNSCLNIIKKKLTDMMDIANDPVDVRDILVMLKQTEEFSDMEIGQQQDPVMFLNYFIREFKGYSTLNNLTIRYDQKCLHCKTEKKLGAEQLNVVPIEMSMGKVPSVQSCIDEFYKDEILCDTNSVDCSTCGKKCPHTRKTITVVQPNVLVIQIKRFNAYLQKIQTRLNINRYVNLCNTDEDSDDKAVYCLKALQLHWGRNISSGHYTTITVQDDEVLSFDDTLVTQKKIDYIDTSAVGKNCYVLYYKRVDQESFLGKEIIDDIDKTKNPAIDESHDDCFVDISSDTDDMEMKDSEKFITVIDRKFYLRASDMNTLDEHKWINDQIVNAFLHLITKKLNVLCIDTFAKTTTLKVEDIYMYDYIFWPLHLPCHWTLIVIDTLKKSYSILDPMGKYDKNLTGIISSFMKRQGISLSHNKTLEMQAIKQTSGGECGIYVLEYARCIAEGSFPFNEIYMRNARGRIRDDLLRGRLL